MTPPSTASWFTAAARTLAWLGVALAALLYLWFVVAHCTYIAAGADSSGYLNAARLLRAGELVQPVPRLPGLEPPAWDYFYQQPLGYVVDSARGTMAPSYPLGLPLHLLVAAPFVGLDYASVPVNVTLAAAAALLMYALGRQFGLPRPWAVAGVALLWGCPLFLFYSLQPMSDMPATVWILAALAAAWRARDRWAWGFAAGLAVAVAVLVRPSNLLVLAPLAVALGLRFRAWAAVVLGGLPGAAFLAWVNFKLYGSAFATGYGHVETLFSARHLPHNTLHFLLWIPALLSPVVFLAALMLARAGTAPSRVRLLLAVWAAVFMGFYVFYFHSGETWWYLRFILPMFPALILAALLGTHALARRMTGARWTRYLPAALLLVALAWQVVLAQRLDLALTKHGDQSYRLAHEWMQAHAPADAVVLQMQLSGCFTYYTSFAIVRWDLLNADTWARLRAAALAAHRPLYATLFEFEETRALRQHAPGDWQLVARVREISIWRLATSPDSSSLSIASPSAPASSP